MDTTERRLKLLEMEGLGLSTPEIVKELSVKASVTERQVYYDFENRSKWQPRLERAQGLYHKIVNLYTQIYRKASHLYLSSKSENSKVGALRLMLDATDRMYDVRLFPEIMSKLDKLEEAAKRR